MMAQEAQAVQDTPVTINGVEAVCTGVGSAKDDPRWSAYPVKVVLADLGRRQPGQRPRHPDQGPQGNGGPDCDAPWILFKAPAGTYTVTATLIGGSGRSQQRQLRHHRQRAAEGSHHHVRQRNPAVSTAWRGSCR